MKWKIKTCCTKYTRTTGSRRVYMLAINSERCRLVRTNEKALQRTAQHGTARSTRHRTAQYGAARHR